MVLSIPTNTVYTHPTSSGNKHIPSGGSAGQILRWSSDGTAVWGSDNNTTYSTGTSSASGLTKLYGGTGSATDGTMTQSAITSALNGKAASNHSHSNYLPLTGGTLTGALTTVQVNLDSAAAIYQQSNSGNIFFRYKKSSTDSSYSYTNIGTLATYADSFRYQWRAGDGENLDAYTTQGIYMLAGPNGYKNCPCHYGMLIVLGGTVLDKTYVYITQLIIDTDGLLSTRAYSQNGGWTAWHKHTTFQTKAHE